MFYLLQETTPGGGAFQGRNIIVLVFKSLYTSLSNLTGMFGVTPIQLGMGILVLVGALLLWTMINGIRGKTSFSLDPADTPDKQLEARRQT